MELEGGALPSTESPGTPDTGTATEQSQPVESTETGRQPPPKHLDPAGDNKVQAQQDSGEPQSKGPYVGSKELNPDGKKLAIDVDGMSPDEIDQVVKEMVDAGENPFADASETEPEPKDDKKDSQKQPEAAEGEQQVDRFYETTGLTQEEFQALPTGVQEKLVNKFLDIEEPAKKLGEATKKASEIEKKLSEILADPFVKARVNGEIGDIPPISDQEIGSLALSKEELEKFVSVSDETELNRLFIEAVRSRAPKIVESRKVAMFAKTAAEQERLTKAREVTSKALKNILSLGEIHKDFKVDVKEKDLWRLADGSHSEFQAIEKSKLGDVLKWAAEESGFGWTHLSKMEPKVLWKAYATARGIEDKIIAGTIEKSNRALLDNLRKAGKKAAMPPSAPESVSGRQGVIDGIDTEKLDDEGYVDSLLDRFDGDPQMIDKITGLIEKRRYDVSRQRQARDNQKAPRKS